MKSKKLLIMCLSLFLAFGICVPVMAKEPEGYNSNKVPECMQPGTIILFDSNTHFIILEGDFPNTENKQKILLEEKSLEERELEGEAKRNGTYYSAPHEDNMVPVKGMKVIYGTDGLLNTVEGAGNKTANITSIVNTTYNKISVSDSNNIMKAAANKKLIAQWGPNNYNKLYKSGKEYIGYGRATTFNDKKGQRDHILKKGDVATSLRYDNCQYGTKVQVNARKKGSTKNATHVMYKGDAGGMDNAIVDIWKEGVEYWGYKYSKNLSLPGKTKIVHN